MGGKIVRLNVRFSESLLRQVKAQCALDGTNLSDLVRCLLAAWLADRRVQRQDDQDNE